MKNIVSFANRNHIETFLKYVVYFGIRYVGYNVLFWYALTYICFALLTVINFNIDFSSSLAEIVKVFYTPDASEMEKEVHFEMDGEDMFVAYMIASFIMTVLFECGKWLLRKMTDIKLKFLEKHNIGFYLYLLLALSSIVSFFVIGHEDAFLFLFIITIFAITGAISYGISQFFMRVSEAINPRDESFSARSSQ